MTFEQFNKAENLLQQYADVLQKLQQIRNDYVEGDEHIKQCLDDCYFKIKEQIEIKLKDI